MQNYVFGSIGKVEFLFIDMYYNMYDPIPSGETNAVSEKQLLLDFSRQDLEMGGGC